MLRLRRYLSLTSELANVGRRDSVSSPLRKKNYVYYKSGPTLADTTKSLKLANMEERVVATDYREATWDPICEFKTCDKTQLQQSLKAKICYTWIL